MKKLFLFILSFFILIPVYADVTTCDSFLISESLSFDIFGNYLFFDLGSDNYSIPITVPSNTSVYLKFFTSDFPFNTTQNSSNPYYIRFISARDNVPASDGEGFNYVRSPVTYNSTTNVYQFTTSSSYDYFNHYFFLTFSNNTVDTSALVGTPLAMSYNLSDIENCELVPDTPPTPPTPPATTVFTDFLTVFTDRLSFLAVSFTNNPYLFCFIACIIAWVILELFLRILHIRGGYKR